MHAQRKGPVRTQQESPVCKPGRALSSETKFATPWSWTSSLQNCEKINFLLFKLPSLWCFVIASWAGWYSGKARFATPHLCAPKLMLLHHWAVASELAYKFLAYGHADFCFFCIIHWLQLSICRRVKMKRNGGNPLAVQWLGLCAFTAVDLGSIQIGRASCRERV